MSKLQHKDLEELSKGLTDVERMVLNRILILHGTYAAYRYYDVIRPNKADTDTLISKAYKLLIKINNRLKQVKQWKLRK